MKYHNFFSFQNVTSPLHAVNVPFISSHLKVSMSSLEPNFINMTVLLYHVGLFFKFFFTWSWIQFFFKEILPVIRNCCITMSEIELVFRRAELRCSGSLFSMLLFKNCMSFKFSINTFEKKRLIHVRLSIRISLLELNYLFEGVKDVMNTQW